MIHIEQTELTILAERGVNLGRIKKIYKEKVGGIIRTVGIILGMMLVDVGIKLGLEQLYIKTGNLWVYFIYVFYRTSLSFPMLWVMIIFLIYLVEVKRDKKESEELKEPKKKIIKWKWIVIGIVILYITISNCFKVSKAYEVCRINAETPSRWSYDIALLKDALSGETEVVELNYDKLEAVATSYNYKVARRYGIKTRSSTTYYVKYENKEGSTHSAMLEDSKAYVYLKNLKKLTDRIDITVMIEYYPNSGTIKNINGISPYDGDALEAHYNSIVEQYANVLEKKLPNEHDEGIRQIKIIFGIMPNSIGKKLSDVRNVLEEECVEFDKRIKVQYIRSKSFGIGEIAFWEGANRIVYVVEDQTGEDMVKIPVFDENTPVEEIFDMLHKAGITFECYVDSNWTGDNAYDYTLGEIYYTPGTMIPKTYTLSLPLRYTPGKRNQL